MITALIYKVDDKYSLDVLETMVVEYNDQDCRWAAMTGGTTPQESRIILSNIAASINLTMAGDMVLADIVFMTLPKGQEVETMYQHVPIYLLPISQPDYDTEGCITELIITSLGFSLKPGYDKTMSQVADIADVNIWDRIG